MGDTGRFGPLLRQARLQAGLSQEALAERAQLSWRTISDLERGVKQRPRFETVALLAEALRLPEAERAAFVATARPARVPLSAEPGAAPSVAAGGALAPWPTGTVTFLFTDVEGSTRLWEQYPQAMREALARHDALIEELVAAHGGTLVRPRGEGDSRFAVFARANDAVAAAAALQQALWAEPWPAETPLRVRLALHTGEADLRAGDYYGSAVNRCARLRALAHGGQILLSGTTYELVREALPPQVALRDLGPHRLKDLTRPEQIFALLHPVLPAEFPPLASLDSRRHNLPVQPTALIGREREIDAVRERLLEPDTRLLTLTGAGGVGKTRLALQVAAEVLGAFRDGVVFVNLAPIADPDLVLPTIAQTLEVREAGGQPLRETLHAFLQEQHLLLVLDNFEQVLEAAPVVADLLMACARVRLLVTSRAALHLRGERLYTVPPLALPELTPLPPLQTLTQDEAVRLFIERARDVQPDFAVTNETAPDVAEICVRLDGLPLAIELAAARVRLFPPPALVARLSRCLTLLVGGARDLPARQQTLRATLDWSYSLLTQAEQTLFARLGVFVGGCTLEAIEAVCSLDRALDMLVDVESLVEKSLLQQEEGVGGEPRLVMLETIREYARERLEESGEAKELRGRHTAYYVNLAEMGEPEWRGPQQVEWVSRLGQDHDNLRVALTWSIQTGATETGLRLAGALWRFWYVRGHYCEGRRWLEDLLARSGETAAAVRAKGLRGAGVLAEMQGDYGRARVLYEEALALSRNLGDAHGITISLSNLGGVASDQGDHARATALCEQALALSRERRDAWTIASTLSSLAETVWAQGDYKRATALLAEALVLFQELSAKPRIAECLERLARVAYAQGQPERSTRLCAAAGALRSAIGAPLPRRERATSDRAIAVARAALGEDAFAAAWAVGQALSLEQAIAEALGEEAST